MKVDKLTIDRIFDRTERLEAPLFQRPYVWNEEENWEPLWESLRAMAERRLASQTRRPHFLGALVLAQLATLTGKLHARQIIDGQQRLTTLQLALAAARDLSESAQQSRYSQAFRKLTVNENPLSDDPDDVFKIWPTNADRDEFKEVMMAGSVEAVEKACGELQGQDRLISGAYLYFYRAFKNWIGAPEKPDSRERIEALYAAMREDLHVVAIDLEGDDDAQEIFETLNALGATLLTADLVKNLLFRLAAKQGAKTDKLYKQFWSTYDEDKSYWRQKVRQGRLNWTRVDIFLHHFLTLVLAEEVPAPQLFSSFQDFAERQGGTAAELMAIFRAYSDVYKEFESFPASSREGQFFYRLEELDTQTIYPLLLEVFKLLHGAQHSEEREQITIDLESFVVRRAVCQLTAKNYNRLVVEMIKELRGAGDFSARAIRQFLLRQTAESARWPTDEEFGEAWKTLEFYKRMKRSKLRMILECLELASRTRLTERIAINDKLTIEHVMPREWKEHWPLFVKDGNANAMESVEKRRNGLIHRIGNLTLLTKALNPSVSNSAWDKKREAILKHSALSMNRELQQYASWSEDEIESRSERLLALALGIWSRPANVNVAVAAGSSV